MQDCNKVGIRDRLIQFVNDRTTDYAPHKIFTPASTFYDPQHLRDEVAFVRSTPMIVAHGSELADSGAFVTADCAGVPSWRFGRTTER